MWPQEVGACATFDADRGGVTYFLPLHLSQSMDDHWPSNRCSWSSEQRRKALLDPRQRPPRARPSHACAGRPILEPVSGQSRSARNIVAHPTARFSFGRSAAPIVLTERPRRCFDFGSVVGEVESSRANPLSVMKEIMADGHGFATAMLDLQSRMLRAG
jgi:hypothetical protein